MKPVHFLLTALLLSGWLLTCCHKKDPAPVDQLPAITQTGANTFGCLLNGQAWTPKGNNGTSNYRVSFDPTYDGGTFDLRTYRYYGTTDQEVQDIILYTNNLSTIGTYPFSNRHRTRVSFVESKVNCFYKSYDSLNVYSVGNLTITRCLIP
jgi:hypothetical protein